MTSFNMKFLTFGDQMMVIMCHFFPKWMPLLTQNDNWKEHKDHSDLVILHENGDSNVRVKRLYLVSNGVSSDPRNWTYMYYNGIYDDNFMIPLVDAHPNASSQDPWSFAAERGIYIHKESSKELLVTDSTGQLYDLSTNKPNYKTLPLILSDNTIKLLGAKKR